MYLLLAPKATDFVLKIGKTKYYLKHLFIDISRCTGLTGQDSWVTGQVKSLNLKQ